MALFVFNRSTKFDFYNWLADANHDIYAATSKPLNRPGKYKLIRKFEDLNSGLADQLTLEIGRMKKLEYIVTQSEYDIARVATLREKLGIPGQSVTSAIAYWNKVVMKDLGYGKDSCVDE